MGDTRRDRLSHQSRVFSSFPLLGPFLSLAGFFSLLFVPFPSLRRRWSHLARGVRDAQGSEPSGSPRSIGEAMLAITLS